MVDTLSAEAFYALLVAFFAISSILIRYGWFLYAISTQSYRCCPSLESLACFISQE